MKFWTFLFRLLYMIGTAAFFGSILSIIYLARTNDFTNDWSRVYLMRTQMIGILNHITIPGIAVMFISGILMYVGRKALLRQAAFRWKLVFSILFLLNTFFVLMSYLKHLGDLANAAMTSSKAADRFLAQHPYEDLSGMINLVLFFIIVFLDYKLSRQTEASKSY
ncbi:hypothetical protein [Paenibacillus caui]|uniref:hypothetical protein n=1 Tax=Paenibacillus caui TaxID=2873927 RepID=UPI001CA87249|nr:hypothetical protein [Paenibacillus caui]